MKIILNPEEILALLKRSFPPELIPEGYEVTEVKSEGYPVRGFHISVEPKEEETK